MGTPKSNSDRYRVKVEEYAAYRRDGYLVVRNLVAQDAVEELIRFAMDLLDGRIQLEGIDSLPSDASRDEQYRRFSRLHMLHRVSEVAERYFLHPRILDVLAALIGPEVLALQTMLFLNPPGRGGQGWHQDAYYITTYPDTLIGSWLALDRADEENGCLWVAPGSHVEPIYPTPDKHDIIHDEESFQDLTTVENVSNMDDEANTLSAVARKYTDWIPVVVEPGDVIFFHSHLLHRSFPNRTQSRYRRAFVSHYCNARSWVPWNHGMPFEGAAGNHLHILARGTTHLPYAEPRFGTPCAALEPVPAGKSVRPDRMMGSKEGDMVQAKV